MASIGQSRIVYDAMVCVRELWMCVSYLRRHPEACADERLALPTLHKVRQAEVQELPSHKPQSTLDQNSCNVHSESRVSGRNGYGEVTVKTFHYTSCMWRLEARGTQMSSTLTPTIEVESHVVP